MLSASMETKSANDILYEVKMGRFAIPVFQRGFEWNPDKILKFLNSLYRGFPVGGILTWKTSAGKEYIRGDKESSENSVTFIIDGQQRITTLYVLESGDFPDFFIGDKNHLQDIYFDIEKEEFFYYRKSDTKEYYHWINISTVWQEGIMESRQHLRAQLKANRLDDDTKDKYIDRIDCIHSMLNHSFYITPLTERNFNIEEVVEIFDQVNSGSKNLSQGDIALARLSVKWPNARTEMSKSINKWSKEGFNFPLYWLLRCITTSSTGEAKYQALNRKSDLNFNRALKKTVKNIDSIINLLQTKLGIDNDKLLGARACLPLFTYFYEISKTRQISDEIKAKLLYWYLQTLIRQRYHAAQESVLTRELNLVSPDNSVIKNIDNLIEGIHGEGIDNELNWPDSYGSGQNRFYQLLYILSRVTNSRDIFSNDVLSFSQYNNPLEKHHIFPSSLLRKHGYTQKDANDVANFVFLTRISNRSIGKRYPSDYLAECEGKYLGILKFQWIPKNRNLWKLENYSKFLTTRRELLADAANKLLTNLEAGKLPQA